MRVWPLAIVAVVACKPASVPSSSGGVDAGLAVAIEGPCPKLRVYGLGTSRLIAYGTYGLEDSVLTRERPDAAAAQSLAWLDANGARFASNLLAGLPTNKDGWVAGDLELGGTSLDDAWLVRAETTLGKVQRGALFERRRAYYARENERWTESPTKREQVLPGVRPPPFPELLVCTRYGTDAHFAHHATERLSEGDTIVVGRCEDELHRAKSPVLILSFRVGDRAWKAAEAPRSELFDGIVNADVLFVSRDEAYLYAYAPYDEGKKTTYLVRWDGRAWSTMNVPFEGPIVSLARGTDGSVWAVARFADLHRKPPNGEWSKVALPEPKFVEPIPDALRVIEVQSTGDDVWVHAAYPIAIGSGDEARAARSHVLYTTRKWSAPLFCDRALPAANALGGSSRKQTGAHLQRAERKFETPESSK